MAEGAVEAPAESGGGGDPGAIEPERGVASIKLQYLTTKEHFHEFLEAKGQEKPSQETEAGDPAGNDLAEPEAKRIRLEDGQTEHRQTEEAVEPGEQPQAQKRARGQNKCRPHVKPTHYDKNRLCPSLVQESAAKCFYGDRCRFLHDVGHYLATKPADLGPHCVLFETFGRCPYGVTCRFAGAHLGPEGQNLVKEGLVQAPPIRNGLDKVLQQQLRKRKIHFKRAEQALRQLSKSQLPGPTPEATVPEVMEAEGAPGQDSCDAQQAPQGPGTVASPSGPLRTCGPLTDEDVVRLQPCEKKRLDISGKLYLAPLTTLEGAFPDTMTKCAELLNRTIEVDFVDVNVGCPIDLVYKKGGGCALMNRSAKFQQIVRGMNQVLDVPLTVKLRTGVHERVNLAHRLLPELRDWGAALVTLHGRSREQRYTKLADWQYIEQCVTAASPMPLFGNGDILSYEDANRAMQTGVAGIMIARGALLKPWLFTEIKEQRHWDISSSERLDILRDFAHYGLEHWGSDTQGVEKTRRFLLEWLSFLCRWDRGGGAGCLGGGPAQPCSRRPRLQVRARGPAGAAPAEDQRAAALLPGPRLPGDAHGQPEGGRLDPHQRDAAGTRAA
ncbi:tRNA-dihydrouridine(47) synthase [NAD(P)(+)]-like isoform X3 [Physeter macrocephalus]|uniref:tRNA-dihydrouridine(47) synthase [NAD(P)(+)] n=1 Tax=Physeter macrocephalus TaxID=9755 RepID=A0A455B7M3_PHYMC|nr:tRNA-dihydrouridine(47) synthase [NAD(P)(+)]-like isoform X3 [Physeter catodon]|eukprot:XP_028340006.1 tRNA-dihydrouridine(47) synthase [NAD(P)(+)]-like isoform X3 [Physeter catodon]